MTSTSWERPIADDSTHEPETSSAAPAAAPPPATEPEPVDDEGRLTPPSSRGAVLTARQAGRRVLRKGKYLLGDYPAFLPVLLRATPEGTSRAIRPDTQLVIEGFPRSGNTFAVFAFRNAQGPDVHAVGHVHHPSQVKLAVRRGLPTLIVIRQPLPCLASYLVTAPHGRPAGVLKEYIRYHRSLLPLLDSVVVGEFDQVTHSFSDVIAAVNDRFGTTFAPFDQSEENVDQVFRAIEENHRRNHPRKKPEQGVPRPSSARADENDRYRAALQAPELSGLLSEAEDLYRRWVDR